MDVRLLNVPLTNLDASLSWPTAGGAPTVHLVGEADFGEVELLAGYLALAVAATRGGWEVVVDLGGLTFLDSAAGRVLAGSAAALAAAGGRLSLVGAQPVVARMLALLGVDHQPAPAPRPSGQ